ncbi:MAG: hypothetical protein GYA51_07710 [Candidatus Methanofastidiosa archaeon]|nr:hypothetical protein [Candidatus Methanofastidiosa archaeon]
MTNNLDLCIKLVKADSENEVKDILQDYGYWDNSDAWEYYGNNENNFSTIGNQQRAADSALVEKIINSVDAVLMKECLKRGINPESPEAPQSIEEAQEMFYNIPKGVLANVVPSKRSELAENITITATGSKTKPSYTIVDKGEGQSPKMMPKTFLSLTKSNKLRIPFVHGKFNMGGSGSLRFSGEHNLQLVVSKRCPDIKGENDITSKYWGFTIVRRENPSDNMKNSTYTYLAPNKEILKVDVEELPVLPGSFPSAYENPLEYGSLIKLYEYQIPGMRSLINFDLYRRLSVLLPNIALPFFLKERRNYKGNSFQSIVSGLSVRLEQNKSDILEEGFPNSLILNVGGQNMEIEIYAFKKSQAEGYKKKEGIIFTINGQAHGSIPQTFFNRKNVGMNYIADSILILADCSNFDGRSREDLFMNSRDRLSDVPLKSEIEKSLEKIVKEHPGLRELKTKRRQEDIGKKISDAKPLADILENVIKKSPTLSNLLILGNRITHPVNMTNTGTQKNFEGKEHPTFFSLKKSYPADKPKGCPINRKYRVQFETDAKNDYFTRDNNPGIFNLMYEGDLIEDYNLNLWNGTATLNCKLPEKCDVGELLEYSVNIDDTDRIDPFIINYFVKTESAVNSKSNGKGERVKPPGNDGNDRKKPSGLNIPQVYEVEKEEWDEYGFDQYSALLVKDSGEEGYDFYVNMANSYYIHEVKSLTNNVPEILKTQFKYGMALLGLSLIKTFEDEELNEDEEPMFTKISKISRGIAPILIPMISSLGELEHI